MPNNTWFAAPPMVSQPSQGSFDTTPEYLPSPESSTLNNTFPSTPVSQIEQASAVQSSMSVRGLREMTSVWSVSSTVQPKIRTRRAMTDAEKKEYRRKRVDGACAECRRRRRKVSINSTQHAIAASFPSFVPVKYNINLPTVRSRELRVRRLNTRY